ncbi:hypothetical protein NEOLEDRAFT_1130707 [Neolentinus lepideus HHB14362 ss-1]|uniref:Uncharacterized protein n=1 Tax=Neolentinus lepideus HHB14362 ss-1 TaxID=1314782 RepID=A0A165U523_9AGAM|nr:hypothetical protein NEOLEDRAFT_1130707 [Neolentinus lepideus HHB14362 ss-1]
MFRICLLKASFPNTQDGCHLKAIDHASPLDRFRIDFKDGDFVSQFLAVRDFEKNEVIAALEEPAPSPKRSSSVQISQDKHLEVRVCLIMLLKQSCCHRQA